MIRIRPAAERGHANHGWLDTRHSFSFADYQDPEYMGFRKLRVINEDTVEPGKGFGTHPHRDMEIITTVLEGSLEHKDSMGNGSVIRPGDIQRMSAGTGVTHSEFNPSNNEKVHLLQIWILPDKKGLEPSYEQRPFSAKERNNRLCLVASNSPVNGAVKVHQDVNLYAGLLEKGRAIQYSLKTGRYVWIQIARGSVNVNGFSLNQGDGAAVDQERFLTLEASMASEFLLFDLA